MRIARWLPGCLMCSLYTKHHRREVRAGEDNAATKLNHTIHVVNTRHNLKYILGIFRPCLDG